MAAAKVSQVQARHNARVKAMQALYQWDLNDSNIADIEYFTEILYAVPKNLTALDAAISECLDRPLADLDPIERAVCRIGAFELSEQHTIPVRVVINECVEITKKFGADQGHRFVNGVMDKLAQQSRAMELAAPKKN